MNAPDRPSAVRLHAVSKRYGRRRQVLIGVELRIRPAEVLAVTGRNGSGKSTLLRIVAGLSAPTFGHVTRGATVIGYVPERFPVSDRMSAAAYLRHMGRIRGLTTAAADRRAGQLLERLAFADGADTPMRRLSKGNAQKVALAQALLVPPELLVLDEPWSGLDASVHGTLGELITEITRNAGAVIFTDHRETVVRASATLVCHLQDGRLAAPVAPVTASTAGTSARPSSTAAVMRVRLVAAPGRPRPPEGPTWSGLPGVVSAEVVDDGVELLVSRDSHDALLVQAIACGWSVTGLQPVPEAAAPTRGTAR